MTLRTAVEKSRNGVAWYVYDDITPELGMSYLTQMRFDNIVPDDYYPASALGWLHLRSDDGRDGGRLLGAGRQRAL